MKIIKDNQSDLETLMINEKQSSICPYKPLLMVQNSLGHMQMVPQNCNNSCPHWHMSKKENEPYKLKLSCGNTDCEIQINVVDHYSKSTLTKL